MLFSLLALFSFSTAQTCQNSSLTITAVTDLGNGDYQVDMDFCVGGGYQGAGNSTIDFWFEVYGSNVILKPNGFPAFLNSGQNASGCTNCRDAIAFYNSVGDYQTVAFTCPPAGSPCPSGDSTCVWYQANAPLAPNPATYFTAFGAPLAPTCPGPPPAGQYFPAFTDVYSGSGPAAAYCQNISLVTRGLADSIRVRGLENTSGFNPDCDGDNLLIEPACWALAIDAGADKTAYLGWPPLECANLTPTVTGGLGSKTYSWSSGQTSQNITVCPLGTTTYTVTVTDGTTGCTASDDITVNVEDIRCGTPNKPKVYICHLGKTKCVPISKVATHRDHGDELGPCSNKTTLASISEVSLNVYPNPAANQATISFELVNDEHVNIQMYDLTGKQVMTVYNQEGFGDMENDVQINTDELNNGIYYLKMVTESGVIKDMRLVVQK